MSTILIVDDDPLQASMLMSLLERQFGDVCRVNDAAEALCLIEQPGFAGKLRLVISRHHSPGIGGPAFVAELHARMPKLAVLVLGAAGEAATDYSDVPVAFIPKPFIAEKLLALIRKMVVQTNNAIA
jgi:DNA-binding NtrC family response regulator